MIFSNEKIDFLFLQLAFSNKSNSTVRFWSLSFEGLLDEISHLSHFSRTYFREFFPQNSWNSRKFPRNLGSLTVSIHHLSTNLFSFFLRSRTADPRKRYKIEYSIDLHQKLDKQNFGIFLKKKTLMGLHREFLFAILSN